MKTLFAILLFATFAGCTQGATDAPAEVKFDRDVCRACGMVISDRLHVAQVRGGTQGATAKFDDIGCALKWLDSQPHAQDPATKIWVASQPNGHYLDARRARFVSGGTTPMGYGLSAVEGSTGLDFDALQTQLRKSRAGSAPKERTP